jgi:glycosyltransferase involved in cell wall biosynthesis
MPTVLHLLPHLGPGGPAKQVLLTAPALPPGRFAVRVAGLGAQDGFADEFRRAGLEPVALGGSSLTAARRLLRLVRETRPAVLHVWGPAAVRTAALAVGWPWLRPPDRPRLVASAALRGRRQPVRVGWAERQLLGRIDRFAAATEAEREHGRQLGLPGEHLALVPPAVAIPAPSPDGAGLRKALGLPADARLLMAAGRLVARDGWRDAVWAYDILHYTQPGLHLVVFGDGPDRSALEAFARRLGGADTRTHFAGPRPDAADLFGLAEAVLVPNAVEGGGNVAREAQAAGVPVVAVCQPDTEAVITDGETGLLVPPHDRAGLAARTMHLLNDAGLRQRLGAAGRRSAAARFAVAPAAEALARLYDELTA